MQGNKYKIIEDNISFGITGELENVILNNQEVDNNQIQNNPIIFYLLAFLVLFFVIILFLRYYNKRNDSEKKFKN